MHLIKTASFLGSMLPLYHHYNCQFKQPGIHVVFSFGSKCRGSRTGIIFNNEMDDFSTPGTNNSFGVPASPANYIAPGKMPMSSMTPTLVLDADNRVVLSTGGSGGTRITTASAWVRNQEEHPEKYSYRNDGFKLDQNLR